MYECTICLGHNHDSRLNCQICGAIPAKYSWTGKPIDVDSYRPIVAAIGCDRADSHRAQRINLRTVPLDYYGE